MRIGPFEVSRRTRNQIVDAALAAVGDESDLGPKGPTSELGASGVINLEGFLQPLEYNPELRGDRGLRAFEAMRSSDGSVQESFAHITAPVRNADWDVDPAGEENIDFEVAAAVRAMYFTWPVEPFDSYLDEALDYLIAGHSVFETPWMIVEDELSWEGENGDDQSASRREFVTVRRFAPRMPSTIVKWNLVNGELSSITQRTYKDGNWAENVEIPVESLVIFVNQKRGDDFNGRSMLRSAYKHFVMKDLVEKIELVALERHGVGTWIVYLPEDMKADTTMVERCEQILLDLRAGTQGYIVSPFPKQMASGAQGVVGGSWEVVSPGGQIPDFKPTKDYHRGEIKGSMLIRFAELGHSSVGARATGDTQSKVWYDALHAVARYFSEANDPVIRRFVNANYPGYGKYPKLVARNIEARTLVEFAQTVAPLVTSGAVEPDAPFRSYVRKVLGAPEEADPEAIDAQTESGVAEPPLPDSGTSQNGNSNGKPQPAAIEEE